jgi:hypothetical protein
MARAFTQTDQISLLLVSCMRYGTYMSALSSEDMEEVLLLLPATMLLSSRPAAYTCAGTFPLQETSSGLMIGAPP